MLAEWRKTARVSGPDSLKPGLNPSVVRRALPRLLALSHRAEGARHSLDDAAAATLVV
jgi:hypothetical protein